jgi:hypothetical protein
MSNESTTRQQLNWFTRLLVAGIDRLGLAGIGSASLNLTGLVLVADGWMQNSAGALVWGFLVGFLAWWWSVVTACLAVVSLTGELGRSRRDAVALLLVSGTTLVTWWLLLRWLESGPAPWGGW